MTLMLFLRGMLLGALMSVPIGGAGILALRERSRYGFAAGFLAACAPLTTDAIVIFSIACSFSSGISCFLTEYHFLFKMAGLILVVGIACKIWMFRAGSEKYVSRKRIYWNNFSIASANMLTVFPATIAMIPLFAGESFISAKDYFFLGVIVGDITAWILILKIIAPFFEDVLQNLFNVSSLAAQRLFACMLASGAIYLFVTK